MTLPAIFAAVLLSSSGGAGASLSVEHCNLGEKYQFESAQCQFKFRNDGDQMIVVEKIKPTRPGDSASVAEIQVPAHQERQITFSAQIGNQLGPLLRFVNFEVEGESRKLIASGFVLSDLDDGSQRIDFGLVNAANGSSPRTIELSTHSISDFTISNVIDSPAWIEAKLGPNNRSISARVLPGAPWAPSEGFIKLRINTPHQKEAWIPVSANIQGEVIPSANPFEIGAVHEGSVIEFAIRLTSRNGKSFELGPIRSTGVNAIVTKASCVPASRDCQLLKARLPDDLPLGMFRGDLQIDLPKYKRDLQIAFGGLLVAKTTEIRKVPDSSSVSSTTSNIGQNANGPEVASIKRPPSLSGLLRDAAVQASAQSALKPPPGTGPLLRWQVANEQQVYGYLINRSENDKGPFVRVNQDVIKAVSTGPGWSYQWRDDGAISGKIYWYYISIINKAGKIEQLSSPQKILAK